MLVTETSAPRRMLFVRLDAGQELIAGLTQALAEQEPPFRAGVISGIGSLRRAVLGYYDLAEKRYLKQEFAGVMELCSLSGNVTLFDERPFVHAHAVISGADYVARGGHLFQAEIAATGEFWVIEDTSRLVRREDSFTGLKLVSKD